MIDPNVANAGLGLVAGLVAGGVMEAYQLAAAKPFGQDRPSGKPATERAADTAAEAATGHPVPPSARKPAGRLVHYATGALVGALYGAAAATWPPITAAFGLAYGVLLWLWLDLAVVPAAGWGKPAWKSDVAALAYGLTAHLVFGAALEGGRRLLATLVA